MEIAGAQSAYRVLDVLTEVSLNPGSTAGEVAKATSLTAPTAHRLLRVLCDRGFAVQNEAGKYVPGPQMRVLVGDRVDHATLEEIGRPLLAQLRDRATETVFLAVREGLQLTYLVVMTSSHSVQMYGEVGQQIPLHATSQGKVILAFLPPGVGERIIDQLEMPRYTRPPSPLPRSCTRRCHEFAATGTPSTSRSVSSACGPSPHRCSILRATWWPRCAWVGPSSASPKRTCVGSSPTWRARPPKPSAPNCCGGSNPWSSWPTSTASGPFSEATGHEDIPRYGDRGPCRALGSGLRRHHRGLRPAVGDHNPIHEDADYAAGTRFGRPVAHGMLVAGYVQTALTRLVAPGGLSTSYQFDLLAPAFEGAAITAQAVCAQLIRWPDGPHSPSQSSTTPLGSS